VPSAETAAAWRDACPVIVPRVRRSRVGCADVTAIIEPATGPGNVISPRGALPIITGLRSQRTHRYITRGGSGVGDILRYNN